MSSSKTDQAILRARCNPEAVTTEIARSLQDQGVPPDVSYLTLNELADAFMAQLAESQQNLQSLIEDPQFIQGRQLTEAVYKDLEDSLYSDEEQLEAPSVSQVDYLHVFELRIKAIGKKIQDPIHRAYLEDVVGSLERYRGGNRTAELAGNPYFRDALENSEFGAIDPSRDSEIQSAWVLYAGVSFVAADEILKARKELKIDDPRHGIGRRPPLDLDEGWEALRDQLIDGRFDPEKLEEEGFLDALKEYFAAGYGRTTESEDSGRFIDGKVDVLSRME